MSQAYLDTSALLAVVFGEPAGRVVRAVLRRFDLIYGCDLLHAEALAAAVREGIEPSALEPALEVVSLVLPQRSLQPELREALAAGPLRGADLWHVACALYVAGASRADLSFVSRDEAQRKTARRLGFPTP